MRGLVACRCRWLASRGKLADYENSGKINEVLEARQQQCRILEQKEEDLQELVRDLEADLHLSLIHI